MIHQVNPKFIPENYQQCTKTVMDNISDPNITFDENGVCNYYYEYQKEFEKFCLIKSQKERLLSTLVSEIKKKGERNKYNCLIGISGGIDSSFVAWKAVELGLKPLAVHFDGGWDNRFSDHNMKVLIDSLKLDCYNLKVDSDEIRDLMVAYLKSSVLDLGVYADHAIFATMYNLAVKNNIKYVLSGVNFQTEFVSPKTWMYNKIDLVNLKDIHRKFGKIRLKTYPTCGFLKYSYYMAFKKLNVINFINYFDFDQKTIEQQLENKFNWHPYPRKHGESTFTTFYQNYILPQKFGVDKRKAHYSSIILSNQISREEAIIKLNEPLYTEEEFTADKKYVLSKLKLTENEFDEIMSIKPKLNTDYKTDHKFRNVYMKLMKITKPIRKIFK